jgi:hypothetical protein
VLYMGELVASGSLRTINSTATGGGRNPVTNRLLRHFNFLSFNEMSDASVSRIFTTIFAAFLK